MCTTSSSWRGPFSTWATALPRSSPGLPVGMSGTQVWPPGRVSLLVLLRDLGLGVYPCPGDQSWPLTLCHESRFYWNKRSVLYQVWVHSVSCNHEAWAEPWPRNWLDRRWWSFLLTLPIIETEPFGAEWGCEGSWLQFQPCLSRCQIFFCKMKPLD